MSRMGCCCVVTCNTLFDMGLLSIDPTTYRVVLDESLRAGDYGVLNGRVLRLPAAEAEWPSKEALAGTSCGVSSEIARRGVKRL